ncbi:MAG: hypothetical protein Q7J47_04005 [Azoarcus sp.]|nr:hypothetical protein [Azoarcus sp.]
MLVFTTGGSDAKAGYYSSTMLEQNPPILDAAHADFVVGGVSINAAACRRGGFPALARGVGCRLSADRSSLTLLFGAAAAADLLEAVRRSGAIAAVFSDPPTHRTVQLKGTDALVLRPEPGDRELVAGYRDTFMRVLGSLGYSEDMTRALLACPLDELVTVRFSPSSAFTQTPGPRAGEVLGGAT